MRVPLTEALDKALSDGALGVSVEADAPVTASLLTTSTDDRVLTVPGRRRPATEAATLLPVATAHHGQARQGGRRSRAARLSSRPTRPARPASRRTTPPGQRVLARRVSQQQGHTVPLDLPRGTAFVDVMPRGTPVRGAVLLSGDGATVIPLTELLTQGLVPADLARDSTLRPAERHPARRVDQSSRE